MKLARQLARNSEVMWHLAIESGASNEELIEALMISQWTNGSLDPDLTAARSFSLSAKVRMQKSRAAEKRFGARVMKELRRKVGFA